MQLSATEDKLQRMISRIENSRSSIAKSISDLVEYDTENPPVESYEVQLYIRDQLKKVGAKVEFHHPGDKAVALTSSYGERTSGGFILYGHADVVPAGDKSKWKFPPYSGKIVGDRVYGRGSSDMKAGLAAALFAYKMLFEDDIQLPSRVEFVSVLDEENWHKTPAGWNTSDWLIRKRKLTGEACVMGEPSGVSSVCIGERGDYWVKLRCTAQPRHGSSPVYEENACVKLFRVIDKVNGLIQSKVEPPKEITPIVKRSYSVIAESMNGAKAKGLLQETKKMLEYYSMNVGVTSGGTMINTVPENCEALIAFCVPLGARGEDLDKKIKNLLKEPSYEDVELELLGESQSNPTYTSPKSKITRALLEAGRSTFGRTPSLFVTQGTSDANVYRKHGIETCFYGPGTFQKIHGYDESVSIKDTVVTTKIYLRSILNYFKPKK